MKWYNNSVIMTFVGIAFGALLSLSGTIYTSQLQLKGLELQQKYVLENRNIEQKEEAYMDMIQSVYSLPKMNDGLIEADLASFKNESYTIIANVRIYGSKEVADLYNQFLTTFFEEKVYDGELVDTQLIPAIRNDLGISH